MKLQIIISYFIIYILFVFVFSCKYDQPPAPILTTQFPCDTATIKYSTDIQHIIQTNCTLPGCHVPRGSMGGDFTSYDGLSAHADPPVGDGAIRARVLNGGSSATGVGWMPASGMLPQIDRDKIDCWLKAGAPDN